MRVKGYGGSSGIMEKKMETTIQGLGYRAMGFILGQWARKWKLLSRV